MTETGLTGKIVLVADSELRGSKVIKHSDRSTVGVPDLSISWMGHSNWIENKLVRKGKTLKSVCSLEQLIFCHELETTTNGRCWVTVFEESPQRITVWSPSVLARELWPRLVGQSGPKPGEVVAWDEPMNLADVIRTNGAVRCAGWDVRFITKLIKDRTRAF